MQLLLSFEDSEIDRAEQSEGRLDIFLAAAFVKKISDASAREEDGFARKVRLTLHGITLDTPASDLIGRIAQGRIQAADRWLTRIPLPSSFQGPVDVELRLSNRNSLHLKASLLECDFTGEPNFSESLFC